MHVFCLRTIEIFKITDQNTFTYLYIQDFLSEGYIPIYYMTI
jgi:hypothetical protein